MSTSPVIFGYVKNNVQSNFPNMRSIANTALKKGLPQALVTEQIEDNQLVSIETSFTANGQNISETFSLTCFQGNSGLIFALAPTSGINGFNPEIVGEEEARNKSVLFKQIAVVVAEAFNYDFAFTSTENHFDGYDNPFDSLEGTINDENESPLLSSHFSIVKNNVIPGIDTVRLQSPSSVDHRKNHTVISSGSNINLLTKVPILIGDAIRKVIADSKVRLAPASTRRSSSGPSTMCL